MSFPLSRVSVVLKKNKTLLISAIKKINTKMIIRLKTIALFACWQLLGLQYLHVHGLSLPSN